MTRNARASPSGSAPDSATSTAESSGVVAEPPDADGRSFTAVTRTETAAGPEASAPSFTAKAKESEPLKSAAGVYVTSAVHTVPEHEGAPSGVRAPWAGPTVTENVRRLPSTSDPDSPITREVSSGVATAALAADGRSFTGETSTDTTAGDDTNVPSPTVYANESEPLKFACGE